jgi:hypothetical protein
MSRHLFVGTGVSSTYTNGILADGKVGFQKLSADGPTALGASDTIADSDQIRVVQGTPNGNKVSPWIYGRNVIVFSGVDYAAPVAHQGTVTAATTSNAAGEVVIKFVRTDGPRPEIFKFTTEIASNTTATNAGVAIDAAFDALDAIPEWLNSAPSNSSGVVTFSGSKRGDTTKSGGTWEYGPATFEVIVESNSVGATTFTAASGSAKADPGVGDGNLVRYYEETLQGVSDGYYNRRNLPIQPTLHAVASSNYDMATIVATKDGSTSPQIKGVDNLIEISIALVDVAGTGASLAIDAGLNSYMASTPGAFAAVSFVKAS